MSEKLKELEITRNSLDREIARARAKLEKLTAMQNKVVTEIIVVETSRPGVKIYES